MCRVLSHPERAWLHRRPEVGHAPAAAAGPPSSARQEQEPEGAEQVATDLADKLTRLAAGQSVAGDTAAAPSSASAARVARAVSSGGPRRLARVKDEPPLRASPAFYTYLEVLEQVEQFPLLSTILANPTLRPYDVEMAARAGKLSNFSAHPGSSFLGAVGQALVWRQLKYQSKAGPRGAASTHVFPEPLTLISQHIDLPQELKPLIPLLGLVEPDLVALLLGGEIKLGPLTIKQDPELLNILDPATGLIGARRFSASTVVAFIEITTSSQWRFIEPRAAKVAGWAALLKKAKLPKGLEVVSLLAIDRGAYFSLAPAEQDALRKTLAASGGLISLHRDLTSAAVIDARALEQALSTVGAPVP